MDKSTAGRSQQVRKTLGWSSVLFFVVGIPWGIGASFRTIGEPVELSPAQAKESVAAPTSFKPHLKIDESLHE